MTNVIQDTTIYISSFPIHEPVTVLTDYIMAAQCLYYYLKLKEADFIDNSTKYWSYFFGLMAISAFSGGCSHAFFEVHLGVAYKTFWFTMQATNIFSLYYLQQAMLHSALANSKNQNWLNSVYRIQLIVALIAIFVFQNFLVVVINTSIALIPAVFIYFADAKYNRSSLWIAYGIVILFITGVVNAIKLCFHAYFNHLDLAHVLIMINLWMMFTGARNKAATLQAA